MAIISRLSDKNLSYNSCFLMVAEPGFGPQSGFGHGSGALSWIWSWLTAVNRDHFEATVTASH